MLDTDIFYFSTTDAPVLPATPNKWCGYGQHYQPATGEFFYTSRNRHGHFRWASYCKGCSLDYHRAWRKQMRGSA